MTQKNLFRVLVPCLMMAFQAQAQNIGIGVSDPLQLLHIQGGGDQYARVRTTDPSHEAGIEFTRGSGAFSSTDWSISNQAATLKFYTSTDNFTTRSEVMRISPGGNVGIGTIQPTSRLHIDGGSDVSNVSDGYLTLGNNTSINLAADNNEILVRNNGSPATLLMQEDGGNVIFQANGGNLYMATQGGHVGVNTQTFPAKLNVRDPAFQLFLRNADGSNNDWYIGASNDAWNVGDNQLIFGYSQATNASILRLRNTTENNGETAPVVISSTGAQDMLFDGNEIDTRTSPLYLNGNSHQNILLNANGGNVGIGTASPLANLHLSAPAVGDPPLNMKSGSSDFWGFLPFPATGNLGWIRNGNIMATVDATSGQWIAISDSTLKKHFEPLYTVTDQLMDLDVLSYTFDSDSLNTRNIGLLAQEVSERFPELVEACNGQLTMAYSELSVIALKALQEQQEQIHSLKQRLTDLRGAEQTKSNTK